MDNIIYPASCDDAGRGLKIAELLGVITECTVQNRLQSEKLALGQIAKEEYSVLKTNKFGEVLSNGELQKISVGRALFKRPRIVSQFRL